VPYPTYSLANLSGSISKQRERLNQLRRYCRCECGCRTLKIETDYLCANCCAGRCDA
jgi:hypothetical protein